MLLIALCDLIEAQEKASNVGNNLLVGHHESHTHTDLWFLGQ